MRKEPTSRGCNIQFSIIQLVAAARVSTKVVAKPMPRAESMLLETPIKGHSPKNLDKTTLLTSTAPKNKSRYSVNLAPIR